MGSVKLQDNKVNKLSYSFCMNLSDVNSKIVFPVEMFATVVAGEGLHLHVYGEEDVGNMDECGELVHD